uniref:Uncharacterized protein n=1 Tax=Anguilla anguilla TaxID=7936 RepID=A0A0E9PHS8_ANGAN
MRLAEWKQILGAKAPKTSLKPSQKSGCYSIERLL